MLLVFSEVHERYVDFAGQFSGLLVSQSSIYMLSRDLPKRHQAVEYGVKFSA
jgi:hypothetical protein